MKLAKFLLATPAILITLALGQVPVHLAVTDGGLISSGLGLGLLALLILSGFTLFAYEIRETATSAQAPAPI